MAVVCVISERTDRGSHEDDENGSSCQLSRYCPRACIPKIILKKLKSYATGYIDVSIESDYIEKLTGSGVDIEIGRDGVLLLFATMAA
ncbi:hypothetical protein DICVIV_05043 [Dictyocaulus viviparus]|uniref:Uncharacterized protein n=1 Tax=Dictyocaulus viviparus TaxID=29172 RepID=A0A0D8XW43_DICVI|nr:hypothetical protein DICVIV_05043 [Dictyocaulus viviparus]